ncbi:hypothetical protein KZP23_12985 [Echinicola marina]|uniref:hypothetical protein n=1 Tax=Echinicola marina TaxID=2859768 RepID=UPI001CF641F1|nr:hypothetical protein [Echinicola marina]UCS91664.1 hypothetical protein KZP23_12985 [Echinicola marina]
MNPYFTLPQIKYFLFSFLTVLIISCQEDTEMPSIAPSTDLIEMEAEGGHSVVNFPTGNWSISSIENTNGNNLRIFGDIYFSEDNEPKQNVLLELEGEGRLITNWTNKGFTINRSDSNSLEIILRENSTNKQFGFRILLTSDYSHAEITVMQKPSQGYSFKDINYAVDEGDGDSLYWKSGTTYQFNFQSQQEVEFQPIGGIDIHTSYSFDSKAPDAFVWTTSDSLRVKIPSHIQGQEIFFDTEKGLYSDHTQSRKSPYSEMRESIMVPSGYSELGKSLEMRKRTLSYTLVLTNNRTNEEKHIEGKWIEISPTGNYKVSWKE